MTPQEAYVQGLLDGIEAYAYMQSGTYYVGTTGKTLAAAQEDVRSGVYPPQRDMRHAEPTP